MNTPEQRVLALTVIFSMLMAGVAIACLLFGLATMQNHVQSSHERSLRSIELTRIELADRK